MNLWTKSLIALSLTGGLTPAAWPAAVPTVTVPAPAPAQDALEALLARSDSPLPPGTRLLSIRIADGLATVDFSHELRDHFQGGDSAETRTVNAVLSTLGQFPTVSRAQILVEGRPIDTLGGLLELSQPLPVIRAGSAESSRWLHRQAPQSAVTPKSHG